MPEGHTAHRLARDQQELLGRPLRASSPQGKFVAGAAELDGCAPAVIDAHGKHVHHEYDGIGRHLHVHLGMQGKWFRVPSDRPPRPQVRLRLDAGDVAWDLIAPSVCEVLTPETWAGVVASLGPDPLRANADADEAWLRVSSYPGPVGAALLDQSVIAGPGNVLRAEALFRAGVHPRRPAANLRRDEFDRLWDGLAAMMAQAVEDGRILTAPLESDQRATVPEDEARMVYKQDVCRSCGAPVETETIGGRTSYWCPVDQCLLAASPPRLGPHPQPPPERGVPSPTPGRCLLAASPPRLGPHPQPPPERGVPSPTPGRCLLAASPPGA